MAEDFLRYLDKRVLNKITRIVTDERMNPIVQ